MYCDYLLFIEVISFLLKEEHFGFCFKSIQLVVLFLKWLDGLKKHGQTNIQMC